MAVTTNDQGTKGQKAARLGAGGALSAGAVALIMYIRSEQGRNKLTSLFGSQFANIDEQLQGAMRENMPLIEESIDRLIEMLQQGVSSLSEEINRLGDEAKSRIHQYVNVLDEQAKPSSES
ncbi:MAG: hypothetical protein M3Z19_13455 [Chloroflexota bacterium]|nr:hypothetical protein [Chloroflexota bacterium]